jgi:hypothetical protein
MTDLEEYQYLWDGSSPTWCLLEMKSNLKDKRRFIAFNLKNHTKVPLIKYNFESQVIDNMLQSGVKIISLEDSLDDRIRDYCRREFFSPNVVYGTFYYLIERWKIFVSNVISGNDDGRDYYMCDLGIREVLGELLEFFTDAVPIEINECLCILDLQLKCVLQPSSIGSIWVAEFTNEKYSRTKHWYYFMLPVDRAKKWEDEIIAIRKAVKQSQEK